MDFEEQLYDASLSHPHKAAEFFGVTPQTIYRWIKYGAPKPALRAIELRAGRDRHWHGYRILGGRIYRADGFTIERSDLDNWEFRLWKERQDAYEQGRAAERALQALKP